MLPGELVAFALLFGLAVGAGFAVLFTVAAAKGDRALDIATNPLPDGVGAVVLVLGVPAVVLDGSDSVIIATEAATAIGLISGTMLTHAELERLVDDARSTGAPLEGEFQLRRGTIGDAVLHVAARVAPLGAGAVLLTAEDRSEAVRMEAVRSDFVANISHELKTPIGAVSLLAEALDSASEEPAQVRRFAERLTIEAARLASITRDIIDFSRMQATDPLGDPAEISLDQVVALAAEQNRVAADAHSISLVLAKRSGARVLGDSALLTTAVHNLIANAVQFSPDGGRIGVGVRTGDGIAEIVVTDQGAGIPADDLERIFERFYRGDPARSRRGGSGGTGLGLSIVSHVAQSHGGDVRVWSRPGSGSTFTIRLPQAPQTTRSRRREREYV